MGWSCLVGRIGLGVCGGRLLNYREDLKSVSLPESLGLCIRWSAAEGDITQRHALSQCPIVEKGPQRTTCSAPILDVDLVAIIGQADLMVWGAAEIKLGAQKPRQGAQK